MTAIAPTTSSHLKYRLPCLVMRPSLSLPPVLHCFGIQAARLRPDPKAFQSLISATSAAGYLGSLLGDAAEAAAERDDSPDHRVPIPPHRFRLLAHHRASDLGDPAENFRDDARDLLVL